MLYLARQALALLALAVGLWLPGYAIEGLVVRLRGSPLRGLARWCLGLAFWEVWLFALAASGLLGRAGMAAGVVAAGGAAWLARRSVRRHDDDSRADAGTSLRDGWRSRLRPAAWTFALGPVLVLLALLPLAVSPGIGWDADVYHLTVPKLYLAHGGFRPVEMNLYSNGPLGVEMLYGLVLAWFDYPVTGALHWGSGVLLVYALLLGCGVGPRSAAGAGTDGTTGREADYRAAAAPSFATAGQTRIVAGWLAAALFLGNGVVIWELHEAYVDVAGALFLLGAFLFAEQALAAAVRGDSVAERAHLLLAGLAAGSFAASKLTGVVGALLVALVFAPSWRRLSRTGGTRPATAAAWFAAPALLLWLPWIAKAVWYTGNPAYPFLYGWFGGPDWSAELAAKLFAYLHGMGMGREPLDYLLLPWRVVVEGGSGYEHFDGRLGWPWLVAVPLALAAAWRRTAVRRPLVLGALLFALWAAGPQQLRLLIPALPLLALATARAAAALGRAAFERQPSVALAAAGLAVAVLLGLGAAAELRDGAAAVARYRQPGFDPAHAGAYPEVFDIAARELPPSARILFLNTNLGFFCPREYLADSIFEASQIGDWLRPASDEADLVRRLRERRVTHLLYRRRDWGIEYPKALPQLLGDERAVRWLYEDPTRRYLLGELR